MPTTAPERLVPELFATAGVAVNGAQPWDIQVHHDGFFKRLAAGGSMALGESYMDGWWDCNALDQFFDRMWTYYLLSCAGSFRARRNQLWQIVFSKNGVRPRYVSER